MSTTCTRCDGTGFLNFDQVPKQFAAFGWFVTYQWLARNALDTDVEVCDCCGDGDTFYGTPGQHYGDDDPEGPDGPYASNGGLCQCH